eukprot:6201220-Pleurochrysis_carterae.AAC.1
MFLENWRRRPKAIIANVPELCHPDVRTAMAVYIFEAGRTTAPQSSGMQSSTVAGGEGGRPQSSTRHVSGGAGGGVTGSAHSSMRQASGAGGDGKDGDNNAGGLGGLRVGLAKGGGLNLGVEAKESTCRG